MQLLVGPNGVKGKGQSLWPVLLGNALSDSTVGEFRQSLIDLGTFHADQRLWPRLLGQALNAEFLRQQDSSESYAKDVFIDRDRYKIKGQRREEHRVAQLYRSALAADGCLFLDSDPIWLLGFQWPTQGGVSEKKRQADLVGMTARGGLVVFEAKVEKGTPPLHALCEGLDYLACLLRPSNFSKIETGFHTWRQKPGKVIPEGFKTTRPLRSMKPKLVILAPEKYYTELYARSIRGKEWPLLVEAGVSVIPSIDLHFAATDFENTKLWEPRPHKFN